MNRTDREGDQNPDVGVQLDELALRREGQRWVDQRQLTGGAAKIITGGAVFILLVVLGFLAVALLSAAFRTAATKIDEEYAANEAKYAASLTPGAGETAFDPAADIINDGGKIKLRSGPLTPCTTHCAVMSREYGFLLVKVPPGYKWTANPPNQMPAEAQPIERLVYWGLARHVTTDSPTWDDKAVTFPVSLR